MKDLLNLEILKKTFDDMPVGVGIFNVEDFSDNKSIRYVFMNKVLLYEMRKEANEVFGKKIIEVAPEAYEHEGGLFVIDTYVRVAKEGGDINLGLVEYSNHMVKGTYHCSVHHIQDNYVYVMLRNVTELEKTKNELEIRNKELSQFAFVASHDLKAPLRTISGFIKLIEKKYKSSFDQEALKMFDFISASSNRMSSLINDLLSYSTTGQKNEATKVDCNELIKEVEQDLESRIKETNTIIETDELPTIIGYQTELRLLFQNLISNAIKFSNSSENPVIKISAVKDTNWTFTVRDNGIGIEEKYKEKIFNIFEKLHDAKEYKGSGIGLAHCKKIVDLHDGKIWVESKLGEGSKFIFTLKDQK